MKVFLYEPRTGGHRETILAYVQRALESARVPYVVERQELMGPGRSEIGALKARAKAAGCTLVHVLTADGRARGWISQPPVLDRDIPTVATYYLYSNLVGFGRALLWDYLLMFGGIDRLLISDEFLGERVMPPGRRGRLDFLPDPWDPREFPFQSKAQAEASLELSTGRCRFSIFGDLSLRKGLGAVLEAMRLVPELDMELLLAGVLGNDVDREWFDRVCASEKALGRLQLRLGYVKEVDVSKYFYAADYYLCAYKWDFSVSSGGFTRACAAGIPTVASGHGAIGRKIVETGSGLIFRTGDPVSLAKAMTRAVELRGTPDYRSMGQRAAEIAEERSFQRFSNALMISYSRALGWVSLPIV